MLISDTAVGLLLLCVAGIANASFALPMKFTRRWAWENTWLAFNVMALLILPTVATLATVPKFVQVYAGVWPIVLIVAAFGAGWGVSQVMFGLSVDLLGIALTFSIVLGISAAVGTTIPLILLHRREVFGRGGLSILTGVLLVIIGVSICAIAGHRRSMVIGRHNQTGKPSQKRGLVFAIFCGLGAAMMNFGLAFGAPLFKRAQAFGANPMSAPNAVWMPLLIAGSLPNILYCIHLIRKNRTAFRYVGTGTGTYWLYSLLMATFWFGSAALYGVASVKLGNWGTILGWPLFMSLTIITASVHGIITGEWKNCGNQPLLIQGAGVGVLVLAVFVLSASSRWL